MTLPPFLSPQKIIKKCKNVYLNIFHTNLYEKYEELYIKPSLFYPSNGYTTSSNSHYRASMVSCFCSNETDNFFDLYHHDPTCFSRTVSHNVYFNSLYDDSKFFCTVKYDNF